MSDLSPVDYERAVKEFMRLASDDFRQSAATEQERRAAICRYFCRGAVAEFSHSELIDFLGVSTPSILDMAGYSDEEALRVMEMLADISDEEIQSATVKDSLLWWVIPGVLAGMPMPFIHLERRMAGGGALTAFNDELPALHSAGVRAVVSLLNIPSDASVYESAGFAFLCLPVPDGGAPTMEQAEEFVRFVTEQRVAQRPVAVHCEAGLGRTGTLLATYLIAQGSGAAAAIDRVRTVERVAVETARQIQFLEQYAERIQTHAV